MDYGVTARKMSEQTHFPPVIGVLELDWSRVGGSPGLARDWEQAQIQPGRSAVAQGEWVRNPDSARVAVKGQFCVCSSACVVLICTNPSVRAACLVTSLPSGYYQPSFPSSFPSALRTVPPSLAVQYRFQN